MEKESTPSTINPTDTAKVRTFIDMHDIFNGDADDDEIDHLVRPTGWDTYFATTQSKQPPIGLTKVSINEALSAAEKATIIAAINKYQDRFNDKIDSPATIPPFVIKLDRETWTKGNNRRYVRPLSDAKKAAVEAFVKQALADGVIKSSNAGAFSQVLLTPC